MDSKALPLFKSAVKKLTDCYREQFPKAKIVYFDDAFPVFWADISLLRVICGLVFSDGSPGTRKLSFGVSKCRVEMRFKRQVERGFFFIF